MTNAPKTIAMNDADERNWRDPSGDRPADLLASIAAIERAQHAPRERAAALLDAVIECLGCLSACVSVGISGDEIDLSRAGDVEGVEAWAANLRSTALEARSHARSIARLFGPGATPKYAVIACPIDNAGRDPFGAVAVLVRCASTAQAERIQLHLRAACLQMATVMTRRATNRAGVEMSDMARVYTRAGQFRSIHEFAYTITNSARQRFNCDQAAMGVVRADKVRVVCISGLDDVKPRSPGVHQIEQAMGECADAACPVVAQPRDRWEDSGLADDGLLHQRWRASVNGACVLSIPIDGGDGTVAVVSFRRSAEQPFDAEDIEAAQKLLAPLAGAIPLVTRATRPLHAHATHSCRAAVRWCFGPKTLRRKLVIASALGLAGWGALGSRPYRVAVPAVVVAEREHIIAAPIEGAVSEVLVRAGDRVEAGQTLLRMSTSALELERRDLASQMTNAELRMAEGVAARDPSAASIAQSELRAIRSRMDRVLQQIGEATVRAPKAGIVVAPELADLTGRVVAVGEPMIAIAEDGSLALELRVPQSRVSDLEVGSRLRFASHARPELPGFTTLDTVAPSTVQRAGRSVFIADAALPGDQTWLRPGMEGVAMVEAGERPNWWLAVHRLVDKARLSFWFD